NATVLTSTRMPFAMAEDGYMPHAFTGKHPRFGTPWIAIMVSGAIYGALALHSLMQLITIYNWLRVATTVMTVLAAWQLRRKRPDPPRSPALPGGTPGLIATAPPAPPLPAAPPLARAQPPLPPPPPPP